MELYETQAPLFPVLPRPLRERLTPGLFDRVMRWALTATMRPDDDSRLSRYTGGRV